MAFDCRSDSSTSTFAWGSGWCRLTLHSLSSVAGGPAAIPLSRGRPSTCPSDATVDVFVAEKLQLVAWEAAATPQEAAASSSSAAAAATAAVSAVVMGEMDHPLSSFHSEHRHLVLHNFTGIGPSSSPCSAVMTDLAFLGARLPADARRFLLGHLAAFLHRAAATALFLGHEAIRVGVRVELAAVVRYDGRKQVHQKIAAAWRPGRTAATAVAFDIESPVGVLPAGTCGVCRREVSAGRKMGEAPCGHGFHLDCIKWWLGERNDCPVCKSMVRRSDVRLSMCFSCPKPLPLQ